MSTGNWGTQLATHTARGLVPLLVGGALVEVWRYIQRYKKSKSRQVASLHPGTDVKVVVASNSLIKLDAVRCAFQSVYPGVKVTGISAPSGVNEQPMGHVETLQGARNRLIHAIQHCKQLERGSRHALGPGSINFAVSIENGAVETAPGVWMDVAWVLVCDVDTGCQSKACSAGVLLPNQAIELAQRDDSRNTLVANCLSESTTMPINPWYPIVAGAAEAECNNLVDANDPHAWLTSNHTNRCAILQQACTIALGQLQHQLSS